jgi:hypothetical protein
LPTSSRFATRGAMRRLLLLLVPLALVVACKGPQVQSPLVGQQRYLCCNLHFEKTKTTDLNPQVGTLVPVGTPVTVLEVYKNAVKIGPVGFPELEIAHKYGRRTESIEQFMDHWFVEQDPKRTMKRYPAKVQKAIASGTVEPGMTKDQVLMAIGYPPAHETPSLASPQWTYWRNRWDRFVVYFDGDKVARVVN